MGYRSVVLGCLLTTLSTWGCGNKTIVSNDAGVSPSYDSVFIVPPSDTNRVQPDAGQLDTVGPNEDNGFNYECEFGTQQVCLTECGTPGVQHCLKEWGPCIGGPEVCNGVDDDCNGLVDDGVTNACGTCGDVPPETCNGIDDNCDGTVDEGLLNACGACGPVPLETCNDLDDDCDGQVDEDIPGGCGCKGPTLQGSITVDIPYLEPNCPFGQGDNLGFEGGKIAARVEQSVYFNIPNDITLCGFEITGGSPDFYFDDHFILTLNNVVLIASFDWPELKNNGNNLYQYYWTSIIGQELGNGPSCMAGTTQCQMPGTQSNGQVQLAFDQTTNEKLVQTGQNGNHVFKVIATGDNDPPKDCHHTGLSLQVKYSYVNP